MTSSAQAEGADIRVREIAIADDQLTVALMDGRSITVPLAWYPRLAAGTPDQRANWELAGGGYGIHWPDLDEDLSTEGLLAGARAAPLGFVASAGQQVLIRSGCGYATAGPVDRDYPRPERREPGEK